MAGEEVLILTVLMISFGVLLYIAAIANRYKRVPPDQAMVVFGRKRGDWAFMVVGPGQAKLIMPIVEAYKMMDIGAHTLLLRVEDAITRSGVPLTIDLVAVANISGKSPLVEVAAQHWLDKPIAEVENTANEILVGHVRGQAALQEVEQINADRLAFGTRIREAAGSDFDKLGLELASLTVKDIQDQVGYLEAMGKARTAQVKRDAIIREATIRKEAIAAAAEQDKESQRIRLETDVQIATLQRDRDLKIAAMKDEVEIARRKSPEAR